MIITPTDIKFPFYVLEDVARKFVEDQKEGVKMLWVLTSVPGENTQNVGKVKVENGRVIATNEHIKDSCPFGEGMTSVGVLVIKKNDYTKIYNAYVDQLPKRPEKVDLYREIIPYMLEKEMKISVFDIKRPAEDLGESHRYLKDSLKSLLDLKSKGMFLNN